MNNTEDIKQLKTNNPESDKTGTKISDKTAIRFLIVIIIILLIYILGMQAIDIFNNKASDKEILQEETFVEETTTAIEIKININSDNIYELTRLKGIGQSKAESIINYRKENGDFISIEELKEVPGIGETLFNQIKDFITIESE